METYATKEDLRSFAEQVSDTLSAYANTVDALRTITLLLAAALAKQEGINREQLAQDVSDLIEVNYSQEEAIPLAVLDFRTALVRHLKSGL